jgi:hypothetical protein
VTSEVLLFLLGQGMLFLLMMGAAAGAGYPILRRVRFATPLERAVFSIAVGLCAWSIFMFLLGVAGLLYRGIAVVATIAFPAAWLLFTAWATRRTPELQPQATAPGRPGHRRKAVPGKGVRRQRLGVRAVVWGAAILLWAVLFLQSQYPPTHWDATSNHLVFAREQIRNHGLAVPIGIPNPVPPALNHYLFVWGMLLGGDTLAQAVEHGFMLLVAGAMVAWGQRSQRLLVGLGAAALWLAHPLVLVLGESAYIDVGLAAAVFLGVYALRLFHDEGTFDHWLLGMALFGMAAGTKSFGLFFCAAGLGYGAVALLRTQLTVVHFVRGCLLAGIIALPWYAFVAWATGGNPLWPLMPQLASGIWAEKAPIQHSTIGLERTVLNFLRFPILMVTDPVKFSPDFWRTLNPGIVLWPVAWLLSVKDRSIRWWTLWALAYSVIWFTSAQFVRYWLVAVPLVGLGIAESVAWMLDRTRLPPRLKTTTWVVLIVLVGSSTARDLVLSFDLRGWPPATPEQRQIYAGAIVSGYGGVRYVNRNAAPEDTVYVLNAGFANYWVQPRVIDFFSIAGGEHRPKFSWPEDEQWLARLRKHSVDWILLRHIEGEWLQIPRRDPVREPFWPEFQIEYADSNTWVFRRRSADALSSPSDVPGTETGN